VVRLDLANSRVLPYAVTLGFLGAGAVVGLVVSTGRLIPSALVIGAVAGLMLLNALPLAIWLLLIGVFLVNGPVGYFAPGLAKISWLFSLLGVFMSGAAVLYAAAGRQRPVRSMPAFIYAALAVVLLALISSFFSQGLLSEIGAGAKRLFQFWGVMFLLAVYPFSDATVKRWLLFLVGVAVVQLPLALYQRVVLVPQVLGWEMPGFVPLDIVVGGFEGSIYGGGASAIMAMYLVLAAIGVFCAYRERLIGSLLFFVLISIIVVPLGLGETKVVLMLIPLAIGFAFFDRVGERPMLFVGGMLLASVIVGILAYLYLLVQVSGETTWGESLAAVFAYNFGEKGYYGTGVNRLTAVPYWFQSQSWADPLRALFGYGMGSSYGVDGRVPQMGHMFEAHAGMHIDLVAMSLLLWDFGFVGAALFLLMIFGACVTTVRCLREASDPWDRVLCRMLMASLGSTLLMMFYSASAVVLVSHTFIVMFTLGLAAWRARRGPLSGSAVLPTPLRTAGSGRREREVRPGGRRGPRGMFTPPPVVYPGATSTGGAAVSSFPTANRKGYATASERAAPAPASWRGRSSPNPDAANARTDNRGRIEPVIDTTPFRPLS
jgi:hypothetical protein